MSEHPLMRERIKNLTEEELTDADVKVRAAFVSFKDAWLWHSTQSESVDSIVKNGLRAPSYFYFNAPSDWLEHEVQVKVRVSDVINDLYIDPEQLLEHFSWLRPISFESLLNAGIDPRAVHWAALDYCHSEGWSLRKFLNAMWVVVSKPIPAALLTVERT